MKTPLKIGLGLAAIGLLAVAYYLISPFWRVVETDEAAPLSSSTPKETGTESGQDNLQPMPAGTFISQAHEVSGEAQILLTDQGKVLRLENFKTLNGPDLRLYLSTDLTNNDFVDLGPLKATKGNVNYDLPEDVDLTKYDTVLIWCRAFSVLFGSSQLE